MEVCRKSSWLLPLLGVILLAVALQGVQGEVETEGPSESECRPYIEKALRKLEHGAGDAEVGQSNEEAFSIDNIGIDEKQSNEQRSTEDSENKTESAESLETQSETVHAENDSAENQLKNDESIESTEKDNEQLIVEETQEAHETDKIEEEIKENEQLQPEENSEEPVADEATTETVSVETIEETMSSEEPQTQDITEPTQEATSESSTETAEDILESDTLEIDIQSTQEPSDQEIEGDVLLSQEEAPTLEAGTDNTSKESDTTEKESEENTKIESDENKSDKEDTDSTVSHEKEVIPETSDENDSQRTESSEAENTQKASSEDQNLNGSMQNGDDESRQKRSVENEENSIEENPLSEAAEAIDAKEESIENVEEADKTITEESAEEKQESQKSSESSEVVHEVENEQQPSNIDKDESKDEESAENVSETRNKEVDVAEDSNIEEQQINEDVVEAPEEDLTNEIEIPKNLRPRDHVEQLLKIDRDATKTEEIIDRISEITLRELKRLYENAIKPLETLYKYRDLSNRHYGDAEIFSKPLILFMGPWSGGKSSIINYLLNVEYNDTALRTGAEPSPAYFNLLMYGEEEEILDGTELAADYTFSGLQKFGQGLEERLRGVKLKSKLLEKVNIVEIPGILEVRKQVSRVFPFNDACQWFIDRADIIFLVYDPSKLDVGPETEAILDQLKGREYQTRIVLNKADQVKPEELMRVQGALIWNISPLMSSPQPPVMYTTSLWSKPYEQWAPVRLLQAQERAFLRDLRSAVDRRIENKIASARRFAVRVRNHAKMVDCYLTTYYNHKSIFGNRKQVSDAIIEHPQDYHIYEGLSTLTNISRYDLPDPDVYKDFFRLNPLYEFQQLSATCTYFRGCPINKLDVAIAYDLPELVGKHKRMVEAALTENNQDQDQGS